MIHTPSCPCQDPWDELNLWIQRRHMLKHCLSLDMGESKGDVESFIALIDVSIRARIRFLYDVSMKQSVETIPMPRTRRRKPKGVPVIGEVR